MFTDKASKPVINRNNKPIVGVIYSDSDNESKESRNLACYLGAQLCTTGYADVFMIGMNSDGGPGVTRENGNKRVNFSPAGGRKSIEVPGSDITYSDLSQIERCHVLVVAVNADDGKTCKSRLIEILDPKRSIFAEIGAVTIFCFNRGGKLDMNISNAFTGRKDVVVVECVVGFAVVPHPKTGTYTPTVTNPMLVYERLSKEIESTADKPLRLMEAMDLTSFFRKTLTMYAWGVLMWECSYSLNVITGGTLVDTYKSRKWRLILAAMLREARKALVKAAKGGEWKPDFMLISPYLSPWAYEMILVLPDPLYYLLAWSLGFLPTGDVISPGQFDIAEGRRSTCVSQLTELVDLGEQYKSPMPVTASLLLAIKAREEAVGAKIPGANTVSKEGVDMLDSAMDLERGGTGRLKSEKEFVAILIRLLTTFSFLVVLWFFFVHDW